MRMFRLSRKLRFIVKDAVHHGFLHFDDGAAGKRRGRRHAKRLARQAALTEKEAAVQNRNDGLFAPSGDDCQLDLSGLNVEDRLSRIALSKYDLVDLVIADRASLADDGQKRLGIEWRGILGSH
ncbi:MAG: hypothetical protein NVS1B14_06310 [Vulcanimicrobiaceae bacterium]